MSDSEAAFAWLQSNLPSVLLKFNAQVDLSRWVTGGDSAGAAIAAWGSLRFSPAPTAFVSIYGMSTCTDPYFLPPGRDPPLDKVVNSLDAIQGFCDERDPAKAEFCGVFKHELPPNLTLAQLQAYWGVGRDWRPPATAQMRIDMMTYEYERRLMSVIGGRRETFATDEEWMESLKPLDVVRQVHERKRFPPAFMVHGEKDWTVPVYHTKNLEAALRAENLPVRTIYPPHELHNFDLKIAVSPPSMQRLTSRVPKIPNGTRSLRRCLTLLTHTCTVMPRSGRRRRAGCSVSASRTVHPWHESVKLHHPHDLEVSSPSG